MKKVILIVCDTLRAKSLPHYGNERNTFPNLVPVIENDFVVYNRAYAPAPWTIPSHLSLFTGLYPAQAMETPVSFQLHSTFNSLPAIFQDSGYKSLGLSTNELVAKSFGFGRGFDLFLQLWLHAPEDDEIVLDLHDDNYFKTLSSFVRLFFAEKNKKRIFRGLRQKLHKKFRNVLNNSTPSTDLAIRLLKQQISDLKHEKLFCFVNLMQTHEKYNPPRYTRNRFVKYNIKFEKFYLGKTHFDHYADKPFSREFLEYLQLLYEEEILYLDLVISEFIQFLKVNKSYDDSLIIITSDHGEHFGENGHFAHLFSVFEPVIRIPMYIKWPGRSENKDKSRNGLVMLQDLYATCVNLLNHWQPVPDSSVDLQSSDKRPYIISQLPDMSYHLKGCLNKRKTFSVQEFGLTEESLAAYVFDDGTKIIENGDKLVCYDLNNNPDEKNPDTASADQRRIVKEIRNSIL